MHRFLMNFIDYDTLDTLFLANWFTDDFDSTDESIVLLKTEPDRDNPKEYRAQDCRNTFHRVHGLIGDLSDEFVKTGFIPDDTVKAFQVPLYDWWDPDTDPREHVVCD